MSRIFSVLFIAVAAVVGLVALAFTGSGPRQASAAAPRPAAPNLPAVSCDYTVLNFSLAGAGSIAATRPISITAGDTFEQFIAPPITSTSASSAYGVVNESFSGGVTGGVTGTFTLNNLNGLLITSPEGSTMPRGFELNDIVIHDASGAITAVVAINILSLSTNPPYLPRGFNGYIHSAATSGSYAGYKYNGAIAGLLFETGGIPFINATVIGRLYTGGGSLNEVLTAARSLPPNRATSFQPPDVIAQFHLPDFMVGAAAPGHVTPRSSFVGTTIGTINGGFVMDHEALVVDGGANSGKGWFGGEFTFSDTSANILTGPWLSDISGNSMVGYVWQALGTGVYTDSLLFGTVNGSFLLGGTNFTGTMSGVYCDGSQIPSPTPQGTVSATATRTGTVAPTSTRTSTPASSVTNTPTSVLTNTPTSVTNTPTSVPTVTGTGTVIPSVTPGATGIASSTATVLTTRTATTTATPCPMNFTDVQPTDYFYEAVRYLYCRGVISGYADNTFRPFNNTTRAQLSKIIVLAKGWPIDTIGGPHFNDVPSQDPFYRFIETAYNNGIITGYADGTFRGGSNVTRAQLSKIIVLAQQWPTDVTGGPHFSDVATGSAFYGFVETAYNRGIISGYADGTFRPGNNATRGQICKIVYQAVTAP